MAKCSRSPPPGEAIYDLKLDACQPTAHFLLARQTIQKPAGEHRLGYDKKKMEHVSASLVVFGTLLLGALGFPFPEEAVLSAAGLAAIANLERFMVLAVGAHVGIIAADNLLFAIGRVFGTRLRTHPWLDRWIKPSRRQRVEALIARRGDWAVAVLRFLPGFRSPGFLSLGSLGYPWLRFALLDGFLALISVGIWMGFTFIATH